MSKSKRRTKQFKISLVGDVTIRNLLDWVITLCVISIMGVITKQLGGARFETMSDFVPMLGGLLALHAVWLWLAAKSGDSVIDKKVFLFVPFLAYAALHWMVLSPAPWLARGDFLLYVQAFILFWVVLHNMRMRSQVWFLLIGLMAVAGYAVLQSYNQYFRHPDRLPLGLKLSPQYEGRATGTFGAPTQFAGLMLLVIFPMIAAALLPRLSMVVRFFCAYVAGMFCLGMFLTFSRGAFIALFVTLLLTPFFVFKTVRGKILGLFTMFFLSAGTGAGAYFGSSLLRDRIAQALEQGGEWSRYVMWDAAWGIFKDHPIFGSGLGSYRLMYDEYCRSHGDMAPLHPHNEYLGTLSELGLIGFALMMVPACWVGWKVFRELRITKDVTMMVRRKKVQKAPSIKIFIVGLSLGLVAFAVQEFFEFHLKLPVLLFWVAIYFAVLCKCYPTKVIQLKNRQLVKMGVSLGALAIAIVLPLSSAFHYEAAGYAFEGQRRLKELAKRYAVLRTDREYYADTIAFFERAVAVDPSHAEAWAGLSSVHVETVRSRPNDAKQIGEKAKEAAEKALSIYDRDEVFWIAYANAVILLGDLEEGERAFKKAMELAPMDSTPWYYYANFLGSAPGRRDEALAAIERSLELNPHNAVAKRLQTKILIP